MHGTLAVGGQHCRGIGIYRKCCLSLLEAVCRQNRARSRIAHVAQSQPCRLENFPSARVHFYP